MWLVKNKLIYIYPILSNKNTKLDNIKMYFMSENSSCIIIYRFNELGNNCLWYY